MNGSWLRVHLREYRNINVITIDRTSRSVNYSNRFGTRMYTMARPPDLPSTSSAVDHRISNLAVRCQILICALRVQENWHVEKRSLRFVQARTRVCPMISRTTRSPLEALTKTLPFYSGSSWFQCRRVIGRIVRSKENESIKCNRKKRVWMPFVLVPPVFLLSYEDSNRQFSSFVSLSLSGDERSPAFVERF